MPPILKFSTLWLCRFMASSEETINYFRPIEQSGKQGANIVSNPFKKKFTSFLFPGSITLAEWNVSVTKNFDQFSRVKRRQVTNSTNIYSINANQADKNSEPSIYSLLSITVFLFSILCHVILSEIEFTERVENVWHMHNFASRCYYVMGVYYQENIFWMTKIMHL